MNNITSFHNEESLSRFMYICIRNEQTEEQSMEIFVKENELQIAAFMNEKRVVRKTLESRL